MSKEVENRKAMPMMPMFEALQQVDIIGPALEYMSKTGYRLKHTEDGPKIRGSKEFYYDLNSPWINVKVAPDRYCALWLPVYRGVYGIIPRSCFHCWKVVAKPSTLEELFKVYELQEKWHPFPCKCGIERRRYRTHSGRYAAFWYTPMTWGLEGGREVFRQVRNKVWKSVGMGVQMLLKRGCTEMEDTFGPSNEWQYPPRWRMYQDLLDSTWDIKTLPLPTPQVQKTYIKLLWIEYARENADKTASKFHGPLKNYGIEKTIVYHDAEVEIKDRPQYDPIVTEEYGGKENAKSKLILPESD